MLMKCMFVALWAPKFISVFIIFKHYCLFFYHKIIHKQPIYVSYGFFSTDKFSIFMVILYLLHLLLMLRSEYCTPSKPLSCENRSNYQANVNKSFHSILPFSWRPHSSQDLLSPPPRRLRHLPDPYLECFYSAPASLLLRFNAHNVLCVIKKELFFSSLHLFTLPVDTRCPQ